MRAFLKRHTIWIGLVTAFAPLVVLLGLQYVWLGKLEETSAVAHQVYIANYLEAVVSKVEYFYQSTAERALNVPAALLRKKSPDGLARYFEKHSVEGARDVFAVKFHPTEYGKILFFDPEQRRMVEREIGPEVRAVYAASMPMRVLSARGAPLESITLTVDERDRKNRIILYPVVDESYRLLGVTGIILDERFFGEELLPKIITAYLTDYFARDQSELIVTVRDRDGGLVYASAPLEAGGEETLLPLSFVFSDWDVGIQSRHLTPDQWARANFTFNMTLSVLLSVALAGGILLAFRAASREIKLSEMKSDFVSNVSHELRTPLASIRVFGEFLRLGRLRRSEKVQEYGEYIETESRRLTQLIDNILDFSRIESGVKTYDFQTVSVTHLVEDTLRTFAVRLKHAGFELKIAKPDKPLPPVRVDRDAVAQVIANLLDNAVKYSGDSKRINVTIARASRFVTVAVRDFGIGISKSEQSKIFERFHRISTGLVHDVRGSGLGLSIVSHVMKAHRGKVTVDSEPGKGSTFTIYLPVDPVAELTATSAPAPAAPDPGEPGQDPEALNPS